MNYGKKVIETVNAHIEAMERLDSEGRELEQQFKKERISGKVFNERKLELDRRRAVALADVRAQIDQLHREHDQAVDAWNALDGSKLHPDAKLLKLDLSMNQTQYQQLVSKHKDNSLMLSLLAAYADRHPDEPLFADRPADEKARKAAFTDYCERAAGVCRDHNSLAAAMFLDGNGTPASVMYEY